MKIAIGGMQKNLMEQEIKKACPDAETIVTNDMNAASMMKKGKWIITLAPVRVEVDLAISILIGLVGYSKCCTVCKNGGKPNKEEMKSFIGNGKVCFGMAGGSDGSYGSSVDESVNGKEQINRR